MLEGRKQILTPVYLRKGICCTVFGNIWVVVDEGCELVSCNRRRAIDGFLASDCIVPSAFLIALREDDKVCVWICSVPLNITRLLTSLYACRLHNVCVSNLIRYTCIGRCLVWVRVSEGG